jgi:CheY-like chemotaxis protein
MQPQIATAPYIMYADDDPDDLMLVADAFKDIDPLLVMYGFANGKDAFEFLESIPEGGQLPCLIILDLNMPLWTGTETLAVIRKKKQYQQVPVIIFTNSDHPQHRAQCMVNGAIDFITKPYRNADLMQICAQLADFRHDPVVFK